ncbi:Uma2 family endonuclease [Streptomyces sp. NPDC085900]|uniref:Uma2 family endonuclease n=1 Tax=Streptomyces sp. NPDC085900 TaxID=3365737 RepID=UPI0037CE6603
MNVPTQCHPSSRTLPPLLRPPCHGQSYRWHISAAYGCREEDVAEGDAIDPRRAHLVIEIVSRSNPANDYEGKLRDYPAMGVPHCLIIDPRDGSAVHYWAPTRRTGEVTYDNRQHYLFGDTVTVAGWKIDTAGLPRYGADSGL